MNGRPRIAVDARALVDAPAGVGYYTRSLLLALAERQTLQLTALSHRPARDITALAAAGVKFEASNAPFGFWWQQSNLPKRLVRHNFDLLWSPLGSLPQKCPRPAVVTIHDLTPLLFPYWHSWRTRVTFRRQLPATLRNAAQIVAVSHATATDIEKRFPTAGGRVSVVHNGVDSIFAPAPSSTRDAIRRAYLAPQGYLLSIGTLEPRKNLSRLLDAWDRVTADMPDGPPLLLAGAKGWGSASLRRRIQRTPRVRYVGRLQRAQLVEILQGALAFVYPSLYEGFGLPVLEAMACGIPVITSDSSSLPEVIGDAGIQVNPRHTEQLTSALKRLIRDPDLRAELGELGRRRATRFSWPLAAESLEKVFLKAVGTRR
jgi:glycosyltransferase involved in cell wall biosynthesis